MSSTHIRIEDLRIAYGGVTALANLSWSIPRGRISALVGPSGCGKSSLLASLNRLTDLFDGCEVSGRIRLDDEDVLSSGCDVLQLRRRVGMIFQRPNPFPFSVHKNLDLPLRERGIRSRAERDAIIERSLQQVGLWDEVDGRLTMLATRLSGGQQQRLCIARALALQPEVILLDEPCSALDPISSRVVEEAIARLAGEVTVVIVTHNLAQARRIADEVAVLWVQDGTGQLIESGPAERVFTEPAHELTRAYITGSQG